MAKNTIAYFYKEDSSPTITRFNNSDGQTFKEVFTAGSDDSHLMVMNVSSTDSSARFIDIFIAPTGTISANVPTAGVVLKTQVSVNINQGNSSNFPDPLRLIQSNGGFVVSRLLDRDQNFYIPVKSGWSIFVRVSGTAVTLGSQISVLTIAKNF